VGKRAQVKREKRRAEEKERKQVLRQLERASSPWETFWRRLDFWIYIICFVLIVAFPFIRPTAFGPGKAVLHTSMGDIEMSFYSDTAPKTIENFKKLAEGGYYNGLLWHRVIKDFMIQTGDPNGDGTGGESANGGTFADEINADSLGLNTEIVGQTAAVYNQLTSDEKTADANMTVKAYYESKGYKYITSVASHKMEAGSVAMANRGPDTNGSQFFIVSDSVQPHLDGQHTVFAYVSKGMEVVKKISEVATDSETDKPLDPVKVNTVEIIDN